MDDVDKLEGRRAWDVEDLDVFKRAYPLSIEIHRASLLFPAIEQGALGDQVRRASKSICANLAEGFGRRGVSPADFRRFVIIAMGSADEMRVWLSYARDLGYVDASTTERWQAAYVEIARMLQGLARHTRRGP